MEFNDKKVLIFPEYHLSDFPPQIVYTQYDVEKVVKALALKSDIVITGYVELYGDKLYSSCLINDGGLVYNIRKKYPYSNEEKIICGGSPDYRVLELSIGKSYFFICNDITVELEKRRLHDFLSTNGVENIFLISAMGKNFEKWHHELKDIAFRIGIKNVIYCDRFNGIVIENRDDESRSQHCI